MDLSIDALGNLFDSLPFEMSCQNVNDISHLQESLFKLAWIGGTHESQPLIARDFANLVRRGNEWEIQTVGGVKHCFKRANEGAKKAWEATCEVAEKTGKAIAEFWHNYKKEILIGVVVVVCVAAVIILTCGAGTDVAISKGTSLFDLATQDPNIEGATEPSTETVVEYVETILKDLNQDTPKWHWGNEEFIAKIEEKLREPKMKNYLNTEVFDSHYDATLETVEKLFPWRDAPEINNYATTLSRAKPEAPFVDVPLLGFSEQSTIHLHSGIANNFTSLVEGGLCLNESLDKQFAVQPHLLHSNDLIPGVILVGLEKMNTAGASWPKTVLEHSQIEKSVNYEVEHLRQISQNILEMDNPNLKQVHVAFSNAGHVFNEALKQLTPEERDTIVLITAGSTTLVKEEMACEVYNIVGTKDFASQLCNGGIHGIESAKESARVEMVVQDVVQFGVGGHYVMQPDYQRVISDILHEDVLNQYEIY